MPVHRAVLLAVLVFTAVVPATASGAVRADADHDKVFDTLSLRGSAARPVLVALRGPVTAAKVTALQRAVGGLGDTARLPIADAFAATATPAQIRALAARDDVAHVEDDAVAVPFGVSGQTASGVTQARADLPDLDGSGLVAAVVDSGVDTTMPDLAGGKVIAFKDLVAGKPDPYDTLGHGSLVSDILAGSGASGPEGRGVAPAAKLVSVNVIDGDGQSSLGLIAQGIQWAVDHRDTYGIDAINLSIGDPVGCGDGTDVASKAVDAAVAAGIVVVAAAGNAGPGACTIKSPGAAESALTVGAMADPGAGGFSQAWFSSRGPTADGRVKPDVMAPGFNVVIAKPGGGTTLGIGTSAAAPFVTGAALLLLEARPTLTPAQVKDAMERTAVDWGAPGRDNDYGSGRLDVYAALAAVGAPLATPPGAPSHRAWSGTLAQGDSASYEIDVADPRLPLAVTLNAPSPGFGLWLRDEDGTSVGTMTPQPGPSRQGDITLQAPARGRYTVTVAALADSGPWSLDVSGALAPVDAAAPQLTVEELDATHVGGAAGTAPGDFPGVVVRVSQGATVVRRIRVAPVLGRWSADLALPGGTYSVTAEQGDDAGNVTRTSARTLVVETPAAPQAPGPAPTPQPTVSPAPAPRPRPVLSLTVARQRLATVRKKGLVVRATCSTRCATTVTLAVGKQVVARRTLKTGGTATLKLDAKARRARRVTVTATAAGAKPVSLVYSLRAVQA